MRGQCFFSAPFAFLSDELKSAYQELMPTVFREIWHRESLQKDSTSTAWVMNPGQLFMIDDGVLDLFPKMSVLVTPSTGRNHIDEEACLRRGVKVYSLLDDRITLDEITASAEATFLLLLNMLRRLDLAVAEVSARRWRIREDVLRGHELSGRQVGLVGFGRIGHRLARYCEAFDARVAYHDPYVADAGYEAWTLNRIFKDSDCVCICCSLTAETRGLVDRRLLVELKKGACLINTSRGEVIAEDDLVGVLNGRPDLRVGLDVLSGEVTNTHGASPLMKLHDRGQVVITPHIAGATFESQTKASRGALNLLSRHLEAEGLSCGVAERRL